MSILPVGPTLCFRSKVKTKAIFYKHKNKIKKVLLNNKQKITYSVSIFVIPCMVTILICFLHSNFVNYAGVTGLREKFGTLPANFQLPLHKDKKKYYESRKKQMQKGKNRAKYEFEQSPSPIKVKVCCREGDRE